MKDPLQERTNKSLLELARRMEQQLAEGQHSAVHSSPQPESFESIRDSGVLFPNELEELQRIQVALQFLNRVRKQLPTSDRHHDQGGIESVGVSKYSTQDGNSREDIDFDGLHEATAETNESPRYIGRFEIVRVLGEGGFARVFLARDPALDRHVALKVLRPRAITSHDAKRRFEREARAVALLTHPHIVPIYEAGSLGPVHFIVSAWCNGPTLGEFCDALAEPMDIRKCAAIIAGLAHAIQHAHQRGIVHRDLKPSNVMLETNGESAFAGHEEFSEKDLVTGLRITDFGLAQIANRQEQSLTTEGAILGTPAYMSPEQARGDKNTGGACDIYALGVMLYEMLTGRVPHEGETHLATLRQVEHEEPTPPRKLRPSIPADLEAICLKALSKDRNQRYDSAHSLGEDLQNWSHGRPVSARRITRFHRLRRWARRNPLTSAALATAFAAILTGLVVSLWQWTLASQNYRQSMAEQLRANAHLDRITGIIDRFLDELEASEPAMITPAQRNRLEEIRDLQQDLVEEEAGNVHLQANRLRAWHRLVRTHLTLGNYQAATLAANDAINWLKQSNLAQTGGNSHRRNHFDSELARMAIELVLDQLEVLGRVDQPHDALQLNLWGHDILDEYRDVFTPSEQRLYRLLLTNRRGVILDLLNRRSEACDVLEQAVGFGHEVLINDGPGFRASMAVAGVMNNLAAQLRLHNEYEEANDYHQFAIELLEELKPEYANDYRLRRLTANLYANSVGSLHELGQTAEAERRANQACRELERLVQDLPQDIHLVESWFVALGRRLVLLIELDRLEEARLLNQHIEELLSRHDLTGTSKGRAGIVRIFINKCLVLEERDKWTEAELAARRAVELAQQWFSNTPDDLRGRVTTSIAWTRLINCLDELKRHREVVESIDQLFEAIEDVISLDPGPAFVSNQNSVLIWARRIHVRSLRNLGEWDAAIEATHRVLLPGFDDSQSPQYVKAAAQTARVLNQWKQEFSEPPTRYLAARAQAIHWLQKAIEEQGFDQRGKLETQAMFASLREDPRFAELLLQFDD